MKNVNKMRWDNKIFTKNVDKGGMNCKTTPNIRQKNGAETYTPACAMEFGEMEEK